MPGRARRRDIAGNGSVICLGGRALRRVRCAWDWVLSFLFETEEEDEEEGKTIPGESRSLSLLSSLTCRSEVVMPASAPTGHAVRDVFAVEPLSREVRALMTDDLPTLG